jgi:hypothetical protein
MVLLFQGLASLTYYPSHIIIVPNYVIFFVASIILLLNQLFKYLQLLVIFPFTFLASIWLVTRFLGALLVLVIYLDIVILRANLNTVVAWLVMAFVNLLRSLESLHHLFPIFVIYWIVSWPLALLRIDRPVIFFCLRRLGYAALKFVLRFHPLMQDQVLFLAQLLSLRLRAHSEPGWIKRLLLSQGDLSASWEIIVRDQWLLPYVLQLLTGISYHRSFLQAFSSQNGELFFLDDIRILLIRTAYSTIVSHGWMFTNAVDLLSRCELSV